MTLKKLIIIREYVALLLLSLIVGNVEKKQSATEPIDVDDDDEPIVVINPAVEACSSEAKRKESGTETINPNDGTIDADDGVIKALSEGVNNGIVDLDATGRDSVCSLLVQEDGHAKEEAFQMDTSVCSVFSNYEFSQKEPIGLISDDDDDDRIGMSSSSASLSTLMVNEGPLEEQVPEHGSGGHEIDHLNIKIFVFPDHIRCGDIYYMESRLTFSCCCIKLEASTMNGARGTFKAEWTIDDIINIESCWCRRVETAMVNLYLTSKVSKAAGNSNEISGIDKLMFSVHDPYWCEKQEAIKLLHARYRSVWNVTSSNDWERDANASIQHNGMVISEPLFSAGHSEPFLDVIYPKGDPDAVSISKRDIELLQPESFINDTVVDFYIKYLQSKILPEDQHRFHFFNSFFFRKLADLDKDPSGACEGKAAFQRVRKWTRNVNLFEKDYIFIPVNYSLHWSLIIICHPGEVSHYRDDESETLVKVPCILHMDSIRGSHRGLKNLVQSYLYEEWKERHHETVDEVSSKFLHLKFVPLEVPQQENSSDCGLFLLHYVELFLEDAPIIFSPCQTANFSNFLNRDWFLPKEASMKRLQIQQLICEILKNQFNDSANKNPPSHFPVTNQQTSGSQFLYEGSSSPKSCRGYCSSSGTKLGVQRSPSAVSIKVVQHREATWNSNELFEDGTSGRPFSYENDWQLGARYSKNFLSTVEEADETGEEVSDSLSDTDDQQQISAEYPATSCVSRHQRSLGTCHEQKYVQLDDRLDDNLSSGTFTSDSPKSSEIGLSDHLHQELEGFDLFKETDKQEYPSATEDLADCVVEDSEEANSSHSDNEIGESSSCFRNIGNGKEPVSCVDGICTIGNNFYNEPLGKGNLVSDEQAAEIPRLTSSVQR